MSKVDPPISEDDLHAFVDGRLATGRLPALERHLSENTEAARRVADYRAQRKALRTAFANQAASPLPRELSLAHIIEQRRRSPGRWLVAASVMFVLGVGVAGGWQLHAPPVIDRTRQAFALLEQEALASHSVYAVDGRHPVEVPGSEAAHLAQWLSNRLDRIVVVPDLSDLGYHLIGGRLLATERGGAAALLMYDDTDHHRISVLLRPMAAALHAPDRMINKDAINGRAWIANGMGVAVVAALPDSAISPIATEIGLDLGKPG